MGRRALFRYLGTLLWLTSCALPGPKAMDDDDDEGGICLPESGCLGCPECFSACVCRSGDEAACAEACDSGSGGQGSGTSSGADGATGGTGGTAGSGSSGATGGTGGTGGTAGSGATGGSGGVGNDGCYVEGYDLTSSLSDLQSSYSAAQWLPTMLEVLSRRYENGHQLMSAMQTDPWLTSSFPGYFDLGSWGGLMESIDTACHEETHGWDFDTSLSTSGKHTFYLGANLHLEAPELAFFSRSEILSYVQQGGSVTAMYDSTYLTGTQGSYDFVFLADELTAYTNGLACATAVADQLSNGHSYRDGVAAHVLYLLYYLQHARTQYPSLYSQFKASSEWQAFVRYSFARARFWTDVANGYASLGINDAAIWNRVDQPGNLAEIEHFTGQTAAVVACTP